MIGERVQQAAGQAADDAEREEQDRQREERRAGAARARTTRSNATWVVPSPLIVIGICMTSRITGMNAK